MAFGFPSVVLLGLTSLLQFETKRKPYFRKVVQGYVAVAAMGVSSYERTHLGMLICTQLRTAILLLLGLLGGANSNSTTLSMASVSSFGKIDFAYHGSG